MCWKPQQATFFDIFLSAHFALIAINDTFHWHNFALLARAPSRAGLIRKHPMQQQKTSNQSCSLSPAGLPAASESCLCRNWSGRGMEIGFPLQSVSPLAEKHRSEKALRSWPQISTKSQHRRMQPLTLHPQQPAVLRGGRRRHEGRSQASETAKVRSRTSWRSPLRRGCGSMRCDTQTARILSKHFTHTARTHNSR